MGELPEWLAKPMGRRRFIRRSSQVALGATAMVAGAGALDAILGPTPAAAAARNAGTAGVKGITLSGLQTDQSGNTFKSLSEVEREIAASKHNFGATHIRLQIQQQTFTAGGPQSGYAKTVYQAINYGLNLGLTVIVNCQAEQSWTNPPSRYPGAATNQFWNYVLTPQGGNFRGHPRVICDLFNEPKAPDWGIWQNAYQGLVYYIRRPAPTGLGVTLNELWADGNNFASSFNGCPGLDDPAGNLVYSFHHPASGAGGYPYGWEGDFGAWAYSHPVVNGEFAQVPQVHGFNWGSPYDIQLYLNYCAGLGIGHTLWTVYGDNYFTDTNWLPYGWWGNMINDLWNPGNGWTSYTFRSSVAWSQNYVIRTGNQLSWPNGLYQGWSGELQSMLAGAAGFNSLASPMAGGRQYRMHVSFQCVWADNGQVAAVLGLHGLASPPSTWDGMRPQKPDIVQLEGLTPGSWYSMDIPSQYLGQVANGYYKGILFGPGPSDDPVFEGHMSYSPEVVIEVLR